MWWKHEKAHMANLDNRNIEEKTLIKLWFDG